MHHLRRREAVEVGCRGVAVRADVFRIDQVFVFQFRQLLRLRNRVQAVARLPEHGADFGFAFLERLDRILAVIENHAAVSVIHTVVNVVATPRQPTSTASRRRRWCM